MGSRIKNVNVIVLITNHELDVPSTIFGDLPDPNSEAEPSLLGSVPAAKIWPRLKSETGGAVNPRFIPAIWNYVDHHIELRKHKCVLTPGVSILARKNSEQDVELYLEVEPNFIRCLRSTFPNPVLHLEGRLEIGLLQHPTRFPYYCTPLDDYITLTDAPVFMQSLEKPIPQLLTVSFPSRYLEPSGIKTLKLWLDVEVEWSDTLRFPSEISVGSTSEIMNMLFENDSTKDITIVVGNGAEIKCHSIILGAHSPALTAMVSTTTGMMESQTRRIEMKDVSENVMNQLLRYFYGMKISISDLNCDVALELFQFVDKYKVSKLEEAFTQLLLAKSVDWFTPNVVVELYCYVKNLESLEKLREHALRIMVRIGREVRSCERFQELKLNDAVEAEDLLWKIVECSNPNSNGVTTH